METRDKKMKDAYKNAKPKGKGMAGFNMGNLPMHPGNNGGMLQYSQNNFVQPNKPQFSTFYGQGFINQQPGNSGSVGAVSGNSFGSIGSLPQNYNGAYGQMNFANQQITNIGLGAQMSQYEYSIEGNTNNLMQNNIPADAASTMSQGGGQFAVNVSN